MTSTFSQFKPQCSKWDRRFSEKGHKSFNEQRCFGNDPNTSWFICLLGAGTQLAWGNDARGGELEILFDNGSYDSCGSSQVPEFRMRFVCFADRIWASTRRCGRQSALFAGTLGSWGLFFEISHPRRVTRCALGVWNWPRLILAFSLAQVRKICHWAEGSNSRGSERLEITGDTWRIVRAMWRTMKRQA